MTGPASGCAAPVDRRRVSIVVPTFNRAESLRRCIVSVLACELDDGATAILHVVDDGSEDATPETVKELAAKAVGPVRVVYHRQENAGSAAARNTGIAACDTDLVLFIDDDCAAERDWIRRLVGASWEPGLGGVGGTISSAEDSTWVTRYCRHREYNAYTQADAEANHVNTANCAYLRRALLDVGGFEALLPRGMDGELAWRVVMRGYRLEYVPDAVVRHYHRESVRALARTCRATGYARVLRRALYGTPPAPAWWRVGIEGAQVVLSLRELMFLPLYAAKFARRGVPWGDALPFAYMDWLRSTANRCGRIAMMTRILTGRQRLDRTAIEPDAASEAAGAPGWARSR